MHDRKCRGGPVVASLVFTCLSLAAATASAGEFQSAWPEGLTRVWAGPEYFGNRMLDWRINDGRLECVSAAKNKPMRTCHLLTHVLGEQPGTLTMSVRTGPIEPGEKTRKNTWTGFLIGVGGKHVDYRISCLCHQWAWPDGGLLALIDGTGRVSFSDNTKRGRPLLKPISTEGKGFTGKPASDIDLRLDAEPSGKKYKLTLSAHDHQTGGLISRATVEGVDPQQLSGNLALVSNQSPKGSGPGYWFRDWKVSGSKVEVHEDRAFGPVLCAQYTLSRGVLKMTAQMGALGRQDTQTAELQIRDSQDGTWRTVASGRVIDHSFTIPFRVENYQADQDRPYRIVYNLRTGPDSTKTYYYQGTIRKEPKDRDKFVVAAFTGHHISSRGLGQWNSDGIWYPHNELVAAVKYHDPDLLFFSGDQIYEGGLAGIVRNPPERAAIDYLYHWLRWCWAFRELARDRPCVCIPDDHDVYHGNIWGAGGRKAEGPHRAADNGGYLMDPLFVNAVHRTQTSHLPDPVDPRPIEQGITVYFTNMEYAGLSFAIVADRMFKSSPTVMVPEGKCLNGWFHNRDFDPAAKADVPGAVLLGERQLKFLRRWADDFSGGTWMKVLLSQTIFANAATLPKGAYNDTVVPRMRYPEVGEYIKEDHLAADADSNGWPQTGRNKALRAIRRGFALHIAGDQHLGSTIQYGVDDWGDAPYALCVPSIANLWPRRWFPPKPGPNRKPGSPAYTGEYLDGFGNQITVHAVSNPALFGIEPTGLYDRAPGYGIVRFDKKTRDITIECWPRWPDPSKPGAKQYPGWPITVSQLDNYGRKAVAYLPTIRVTGMSNPVVQVIDESDGEVLYTLRIKGTSFRPKVFNKGKYTLKVGEPGTAKGKRIQDIQSLPAGQSKTLDVKL